MKKPVLLLLLVAGVSLSSYAQLGGLGGFVKKASGVVQQAGSLTNGSTPGGGAPGESDSNARGATVTDEPVKGAISPAHAKNKKKIIFASSVEALATQKENEAAFGTTFTLGKPIYFRAYMENSLANMAHRLQPDVSREVTTPHSKFHIKFTLDGAPAYAGGFDLPEEVKDYASFKGALQSGGETYLGMLDFQAFLTQNEAKLKPGAHKLKIELLPALEYPEEKEGAVAATGEITLNVGASIVNPNDTKTCLPAAGMKDPALEAKMFVAFKAKGWPEKPTSVRITGTKWNIVRNQLTGVIIKRSIPAVVASTNNGSCRYQEFVFSQDYDGAGYQPDVYLDGVGGPTDIPCGCLK